MRSRSIVGITLVVSVAVLLVAGGITYRATRVLSAATAGVMRTKDASLSLEQTLSLLRDAETGQRGFLLAQRDEYLVPYTDALKSVSAQLEHLESLYVDDT